MPKLTDFKDLDYARVKKAALRIAKSCDDANFIAPEALDVHRDNIRAVCRELQEICDALLITPPGAGHVG